MYVILKMRTKGAEDRLLGKVEYQSVEEAYLDVCASIPDLVADKMRKKQNPFLCSFIISSESGVEMMEVPFSELISSVPIKPVIENNSQKKFLTFQINFPAGVDNLLSRSVDIRQKSKLMRERVNKIFDQLHEVRKILK